jgi:hypothetical protein
MGIIYIPDDIGKNTQAPNNQQPYVIVMPPDKGDKKTRKATKKERLFAQFLKMAEEDKKKKTEDEKKKAEANKPKTFTYLETVGIAMMSSIPVAIALTAMLNLFQNAMGQLLK